MGQVTLGEHLATEHDIIVGQSNGRQTFPPQSIFYLIFIFTTQLNAALLSLFIVTVLVPSNFWLQLHFFLWFY